MLCYSHWFPHIHTLTSLGENWRRNKIDDDICQCFEPSYYFSWFWDCVFSFNRMAYISNVGEWIDSNNNSNNKMFVMQFMLVHRLPLLSKHKKSAQRILFESIVIKNEAIERQESQINSICFVTLSNLSNGGVGGGEEKRRKVTQMFFFSLVSCLHCNYQLSTFPLVT